MGVFRCSRGDDDVTDPPSFPLGPQKAKSPPEELLIVYPAFLYTFCNRTIINNTLRHGSISKVDLVLPPSLGAAFLSTCRAHLSSPIVPRREGRNEHGTDISELRQLLRTLPMMLGVQGAGEVVLTRAVREIASSHGTLECELSVVFENSEGMRYSC